MNLSQTLSHVPTEGAPGSWGKDGADQGGSALGPLAGDSCRPPRKGLVAGTEGLSRERILVLTELGAHRGEGLQLRAERRGGRRAEETVLGVCLSRKISV